MRRAVGIAVLAAALLAALWIAWNRFPDRVQQQSRFLMDTYCTIRVPGTAAVQGALTKAFERMEDIDRRFNALNPTSPVYRFNSGGVPIEDPDIVEVVAAALGVSERTGGAFDVTIEPLVSLWGFYGPTPAVPEEARIAECRRRVGWRHLAIEKGRLVRLRDDIRIDLGAIAKGYAVAEAVRILKQSGIESALVDAGGDIYAFGKIEGRPWRVGIRNPRGERILGVLDLADQSTATSGDYERFFEKDGIRYHHILDPATGYPARGAVSVTILSSNAVLADAWSTAVFVLGPEKGLRSLEGLPDVTAMVVTPEGKRFCSPGLQARIRWTPDPERAPEGGTDDTNPRRKETKT